MQAGTLPPRTPGLHPAITNPGHRELNTALLPRTPPIVSHCLMVEDVEDITGPDARVELGRFGIRGNRPRLEARHCVLPATRRWKRWKGRGPNAQNVVYLEVDWAFPGSFLIE